MILIRPYPGLRLTNRGFTLLELLVVLIIISLMAVLVAPNLAGFLSGMNLKTAAKKISAALRYAQSRAISEKVTCTAYFDFEKSMLFVLTVGGLPDEIDPKLSDKDTAKTEKAKTYYLPDGIRFEKCILQEDEFDSGIFKIVFFPGGGNTGGAVILVDDREKKCKISVDFITGGVKLIVS
ncbi:MAG: prepilin-type N-terminal cleavage/methylation domain-containing protein [Desulfobacterales bacterium]|nr:prepilin-type N-terminal cleavage/methylation domain-containing protein [Desulfobacterales bacterium]